MTKYDKLTERENGKVSIVLTFAELSRLVELPPSALKDGAWWANSRNAHAHAAIWLDAGYNAIPGFVAGRVRFVRGSNRRPVPSGREGCCRSRLLRPSRRATEHRRKGRSRL